MNTTTPHVLEQMVWDRLAQIPDPEVPVISIVELGIIRKMHWDGERLHIAITPTYTGCPAISLFVAEIRAAVHDMGIDRVFIDTVYAPAWTTDFLTDEAKEKLRRYGIAPPVKAPAGTGDPFTNEEEPIIPCPRCGSVHTDPKSTFGSTACKALYICRDCREPFEYFKHF